MQRGLLREGPAQAGTRGLGRLHDGVAVGSVNSYGVCVCLCVCVFAKGSWIVVGRALQWVKNHQHPEVKVNGMKSQTKLFA